MYWYGVHVPGKAVDVVSPVRVYCTQISHINMPKGAVDCTLKKDPLQAFSQRAPDSPDKNFGRALAHLIQISLER